jgi:hypothetical protein
MSKSTCNCPSTESSAGGLELATRLGKTLGKRGPFRPWMLLVVVLAITIGLGLLSRLISYLTL